MPVSSIKSPIRTGALALLLLSPVLFMLGRGVYKNVVPSIHLSRTALPNPPNNAWPSYQLTFAKLKKMKVGNHFAWVHPMGRNMTKEDRKYLIDGNQAAISQLKSTLSAPMIVMQDITSPGANQADEILSTLHNLMVENKRYAYTQSPELTLNATLDLLEMERQMLIFIGSNNFYLGREYFSEDFSKLGTLNEIDIESGLRRLEGLSNGLPKNSDVLKCLRFQYQRVLSNPVEMAASNKSSLQMQRAPVTETNITEAIKLIDSLIAQVDLPTFNKMPFPPDPLWNTSMSMYWRDPRMAENIYRSTVEKLRVELALRSYHFKNGEYPSKLEELAPQILKTIPTDYRHNGQSYYYKSDAANDSFFLDDMIKEKK